MKKRLIATLVTISVVATYIFNCSFTASPYGITEADASGISQTRGDMALPEYYSAYDEGLLTGVNAQGTTSICWAFAHNEIISANVAKNTGVLYDFSEQAMKFDTSYETNEKWGYQRGVNDGGNEVMSTAYLARGGSVLEADEPFSESDVRTVDPDTLRRYGYLKNTTMYDYGVYDVRESSGYDEEYKANMRANKTAAIQKVKELVYTQGAVGAGIWYEYSRLYENTDKTGYYYNGNSATPNHTVTIVGWDDNVSKNIFAQRPEGNGAFIVKNSWGNYHNNGTEDYVYISYYDKHITSQLFASEYEMQNDLYDNIYQYDGYGWTSNGYVEEPSVLCITRFNATKINEAVSAVSTYITAADTTVDVYINAGGKLKDKSAYKKVATRTFDASGYYLIEFDAIKLTRGEYYVALDIKAGGDRTEFAMQTNVRDVCPDAMNTPDTCYVGTTFTNVVTLESIYKKHVFEPMHCIKSFTVSLDDGTAPSGKVFSDVKRGKWYADEIEYCVAHGIFTGISDTTFEPDSSMTRAMFVKVLANLSGDKMQKYATPFTDLEKGRWYESAVAWAYKNKIVSGVTKTTFEPNTLVTREQICFMLTKYAEYMGIALREQKAATDFADKSSISKYAREAVSLCQVAGIVNGMPDGSFAPKKNATRAEASVMMTQLCKTYIY